MIFMLPDEATLPFVGNNEVDYYEGGFGPVSKIFIHPDHHDLKDPGDTPFAIRKFRLARHEGFKLEFDVLSKLGKTQNRHLMSVLGGFCQRDNYLIFDWVDSDLPKYWMTHESPDFNYDTVLWVAEQCVGLASGLRRVHRDYDIQDILELGSPGSEPPWLRKYGIHGDIKPENILWFNDGTKGGTLKIADFDLPEFSTRDNTSNRSIAISHFYRPPEADLRNGIIRPSYNMWSIGCVYLEFLGWLLGGWSLVRVMAIARQDRDRGDLMGHNPYYDIINEQTAAVIKPEVYNFIHYAHCHPKCSMFVHEFLDVIQNDLLVVETEDASSLGGAGSDQLRTLLRKMHANCKHDIDYAVKPCPWVPDPSRA